MSMHQMGVVKYGQTVRIICTFFIATDCQIQTFRISQKLEYSFVDIRYIMEVEEGLKHFIGRRYICFTSVSCFGESVFSMSRDI